VRSIVPGRDDAWEEIIVCEPRVLEKEGVGFGDGCGNVDNQRNVILRLLL